MRISRFAVIILASAFVFQAASAQQPGREKVPVAYPTRDSLSKSAIEEQYSAEINKYRSQAGILNKEIAELENKIRILEQEAAQAEKDYQLWKINFENYQGRKDPNAPMWKQKDLQKKLDQVSQQVKQYWNEIDMKEVEVKSIQLYIADLQKEKEALLKKAT